VHGALVGGDVDGHPAAVLLDHVTHPVEVAQGRGVDHEPAYPELGGRGEGVVVAQPARDLHVGAATDRVDDPGHDRVVVAVTGRGVEVGDVQPRRALLHPASRRLHRVAEGAAAVDMAVVEQADLAAGDLDPGEQREAGHQATTRSRCARSAITSAMIQPTMVHPSRRLTQNTDQCGTAHGDGPHTWQHVARGEDRDDDGD
jgi:hypothetical protein